MNSAVITNIEYRLPGDQEFISIDFIPESGKFNEEPKRTSSGIVYNTTVDFNIAGLTVIVDELIKKLQNRKAYFKITDSTGLIFCVGTEIFPARLSAKSALDGSPGAFRGYRCTIVQNSTTGCIVMELI